jgi:hypothetical protein
VHSATCKLVTPHFYTHKYPSTRSLNYTVDHNFHTEFQRRNIRKMKCQARCNIKSIEENLLKLTATEEILQLIVIIILYIYFEEWFRFGTLYFIYFYIICFNIRRKLTINRR